MAQTMPTGDAETMRKQLREEFPEWSFIISTKNRWWASHTVTSETLGRDALEADSAEELRALLLEKTRRGGAR